MTSPGAKRIAARACASAEKRSPIRYETSAWNADASAKPAADPRLRAVSSARSSQYSERSSQSVIRSVFAAI